MTDREKLAREMMGALAFFENGAVKQVTTFNQCADIAIAYADRRVAEAVEAITEHAWEMRRQAAHDPAKCSKDLRDGYTTGLSDLIEEIPDVLDALSPSLPHRTPPHAELRAELAAEKEQSGSWRRVAERLQTEVWSEKERCALIAEGWKCYECDGGKDIATAIRASNAAPPQTACPEWDTAKAYRCPNISCTHVEWCRAEGKCTGPINDAPNAAPPHVEPSAALPVQFDTVARDAAHERFAARLGNLTTKEEALAKRSFGQGWHEASIIVVEPSAAESEWEAAKSGLMEDQGEPSAAFTYQRGPLVPLSMATEARMLELARDMDSGGIWEDAAFELKSLVIETFGEKNVMDWQPILTAPRDGTDVLLARPPQRNGKTTPPAVGGWFGNGFYSWEGPERPIDATHWMPLPPPPASEAQ